MPEDYKPSLSEITTEMFRDVYGGAKRAVVEPIKEIPKAFGKGYEALRSVDVKNIDWKQTLKNTGKAGVSFVGITASINIVPYAIPSVHRFFKEEEKESFKLTKPELLGGYLGFMMGICGVSVQFLAYLQAAISDGRPEVLLLPVATNIASGVYEKSRSVRNKLIQERSLENEVKSV